jgi:hypothetical protein
MSFREHSLQSNLDKITANEDKGVEGDRCHFERIAYALERRRACDSRNRIPGLLSLSQIPHSLSLSLFLFNSNVLTISSIKSTVAVTVVTVRFRCQVRQIGINKMATRFIRMLCGLVDEPFEKKRRHRTRLASVIYRLYQKKI